MFKDYDKISLTAEYTCLKQLMAVYKYVKPAKKIPDLEKIAQNISSKKKIGLSSRTDCPSGMGDFFYHRDHLPIQVFITLIRSFILKYTTETSSPTLGATAKDRRKAITPLLKAGNLEFSFTHKTFQITISAINLLTQPPTPNSTPGICIVILDMSEKYRPGQNTEKNTFKNLLLNSVQHELHTPLTFIVSYGEQIHSQMKSKYDKLFCGKNLDGAEDIGYVLYQLGVRKDYEDVILFLSQTLYHSMHMCILLQSYSDFASIDGPGFRLGVEKVNVWDAVQGVISMYYEYAESKDVRVEQVYGDGGGGADLKGWPTDKIRFQIIISTMLHNAIKYCPEGGRVKIQLDRKGDVLYVNLKDNGIGISDVDLVTLGQILNNHLLKSSTTNSSGTCLGLKLCSSLLRYMAPKNNNKLKFDTVLGKGCNISFC